MSTFVRTVNCFGGSFTYGYGDRETQLGWAGRLKQHFHSINEVEGVEYERLAAFYNLGIIGNTAAKIYDRVAREKRVRQGKAVLNILSVGLNDSAIWEDGSTFTEEDEFQNTLHKIYDVIAEDNCVAMYIGCTSLDEARTARFRGSAVTYTKERGQRFEALALDVAKERGIVSVPLFEATDNMEYLTTMLDKDGLHPNTSGYKWVYERVVGPATALMGTID